MKAFNFTLIVILIFSISSCAFMQPTPDKLNSDIEHWLSQNEYDKIDNALKGIDKKNAKYKFALDQKSVIENKKQAFIKNTSDKAKKSQRDNKWQQSLDAYNHALEKIQDQPKLSQEKADLILERDEQIDTLKKDMMMQRANALISYKKIYEKLLALIPEDKRAQQDIHHYNMNRIEVANQLNMCGDQARKNKQYLLASDCYALSNKLAPTKQKQLWVTSINKQLIKKSNQKSNNELLAAYRSAYKKQQYQKARQHLSALLASNPSHENNKKLLRTLNNEISVMALKRITAGKTLYNKKRINEALKEWQQALLLEPDNAEIIQLINRAEKVSKKIQSLEKNQ